MICHRNATTDEASLARKGGKQWKRVEGNAYLYGELDDKNKPHGDSILYFYPDICTVIRGNYHHGILERGKNMNKLGPERRILRELLRLNMAPSPSKTDGIPGRQHHNLLPGRWKLNGS